MRAGQLRHRIQLQRRTGETRDGATGEVTPAYTTYATVWADVQTVSGQEAEAAVTVYGTRTHVVALRFRSDVRPEDRALHGATVLHIEVVRDPQGRRRELELLCTELRP